MADILASLAILVICIFNIVYGLTSPSLKDRPRRKRVVGPV